MTTIFLDIDGVLTTVKQYNLTQQSKTWIHGTYNDGRGVYPFDKKCVDVFNSILKEVDAEIVISSDWRDTCTLNEMMELFKINGIIVSPIAYTDSFPTSMSWLEKNRAGEILKYVNEHNITKYIAIDDLNLREWLSDEHFQITGGDWDGIKKSGIKDKIINKIKKQNEHN